MSVPFNITRAAHAEIRVTDLEKANAFYVGALGMIAVARDEERLYLGGLEERDKYSLVLRQAESPGLGHIAFRVAEEGDLFEIEKICKEDSLPHKWIFCNTLEWGQGLALRIQDIAGFPVEFYHHMEQRERLLQRYDLYRGACIMRIDHFNVQVPAAHSTFDWWTKRMGFYLSEYIVVGDKRQLWAAWLHRKQNVHDLAIMTGVGPRFHHVGMWVDDRKCITHACDILASCGMKGAIERGPGRHGLSNAFFVYLRDPDGNRIELFTGDYLIPDPDFEPVEWNRDNPQTGTFWGQPAPSSWFDEASFVEDIYLDQFVKTSEPTLSDRPSFIAKIAN